MSDYISRETIMAIIDTAKKMYLHDFNAVEVVQQIVSKLNNMPSEDVQPVKHGRWIGIYEYCEKNGYIPSGMGIYYWCSECDKSEKKTSDYCPHCGARMDGEQND